MFDQIPVHVFLLIAIATAAYAPALYAFRYIAASPSRRDITQPTEDLTWRTSTQFARSFCVLAALAALSIFIFTPAAEQFARSPSFFPILMGSIGAWALFTVSVGVMTGQVQPFGNGFNKTYQREAHPKRFWASLVWNAFFSCLCLWLAYQLNDDASKKPLQDKCYDEDGVYPPQEQLTACNKLIGGPGSSNDADAYLDRGLVFLDIGKFDEALADFTRAHELDPKDPWPLANRGIAFAWSKNQAHAENDFRAVRAIDPTNPVMLRGEAVLRMTSGDIQGAVKSLSASMIRDPDNLWALRTRAELYWELGEEQESRDDDNRWLQLKKEERITRD